MFNKKRYMKKYGAIYRKHNKSKIKKQRKEHRLRPEIKKQQQISDAKYYIKNRNKRIYYSKVYRITHKERVSKYMKKYSARYYRLNKLKIAKYNKFYHQKKDYTKNKKCSCGRKITDDSKNCKLCNMTSPKTRRIKYRNNLMRSLWEVKYAKFLTKKHIKWYYEHKTFQFKNYDYTPDFYLPDSDTYVEIKGYWRENSKLKYYNFKRKFGNIKLLNKSRLKKLGVL